MKERDHMEYYPDKKKQIAVAPHTNMHLWLGGQSWVRDTGGGG